MTKCKCKKLGKFVLVLFEGVFGDGREDEVSSSICLASAWTMKLDQIFGTKSVLSSFQFEISGRRHPVRWDAFRRT
jgi:hypothetical protein